MPWPQEEVQLPEAAQKFIQQHFAKSAILSVEEVEEKTYQVLLSDSATLNFDKAGEWTCITAGPKGFSQKQFANDPLLDSYMSMAVTIGDAPLLRIKQNKDFYIFESAGNITIQFKKYDQKEDASSSDTPQ